MAGAHDDLGSRVAAQSGECSVIPDLDVIGFRFGIRDGDFWGHRGFAHSLAFAALLAFVIVVLGFRHGVTGMHALTMWLYLFLATASHGLLDAMTDGGLGVALYAPFDNHRYFFPSTQCPTLILAALTVMAAGCKQMSKTAPVSRAMPMMLEAYAASPQRYKAERHKLEIIASEAELQKSWDSTVAF